MIILNYANGVVFLNIFIAFYNITYESKLNFGIIGILYNAENHHTGRYQLRVDYFPVGI